MPVAPGRWRGKDSVFRGHQVFDERDTVGVGFDDAEWITEGILRHLAAGLAIGAASLEDFNSETCESLFLG